MYTGTGTPRLSFAIALIAAWLAIAPDLSALPRVVASSSSPASGMEYRRNRGAAWAPITKDTKLAVGYAIRTTSKASTMTLIDGATIHMGPQTVLELRDPTQTAVRGRDELAHRVDLRQGALHFELDEAAKRVLLVVHTNEILGVFGRGEGRTEVVPDGMLAVVERGAAKVASHGRWVDLAQGWYAILGARGPRGQPKELVATPKFVSRTCRASTTRRCAIAWVTGSEKARVAVRWEPVARVRSYRVRLASDARMTALVTERNVTSPTEFVSPPLAPGRYWVTVQPVGTDGVAGRSAGPRPLRVVGLRLDEGAQADPAHNIVVLPEGARVHVQDAEGLRMLAASGDNPMPSSVRLLRNQHARTANIAIAGNLSDIAPLAIEGRQVQADVRLSPMTARWPKDPVSVRVRVHDPSGRYSVRDLQPKIEVTVNLQEVSLPFKQSGDTWEAVVEPRQGGGPWVIRVDVKDKEGRPLGRNFLEVIGAEP